MTAGQATVTAACFVRAVVSWSMILTLQAVVCLGLLSAELLYNAYILVKLLQQLQLAVTRPARGWDPVHVCQSTASTGLPLLSFWSASPCALHLLFCFTEALDALIEWFKHGR
jgi:hypothetical protein